MIVYRTLGIQIREAIKNGELKNILPDGYFSVSDGKPVKIEQPRKDNKGLIQDFVIMDLVSIQEWFTLEKHSMNNGFLNQTKKKKISKNLEELDDKEFEEAFKEYQEKLNRIPKPRVKRNND